MADDYRYYTYDVGVIEGTKQIAFLSAISLLFTEMKLGGTSLRNVERALNEFREGGLVPTPLSCDEVWELLKERSEHYHPLHGCYVNEEQFKSFTMRVLEIMKVEILKSWERSGLVGIGTDSDGKYMITAMHVDPKKDLDKLISLAMEMVEGPAES